MPGSWPERERRAEAIETDSTVFTLIYAKSSQEALKLTKGDFTGSICGRENLRTSFPIARPTHFFGKVKKKNPESLVKKQVL